MTMTPTVSVVIVTRDRPALLADALRSVAAQTFSACEVRLADDGEAPSFPDLPDLPLLELVVMSVEARQAARARNLACAGARGDVIAFLDDDDRWLPTHLAGLAAAFRDPEVEFAWRDSAVIRERVEADGSRVELEHRVMARDWDAAAMRVNAYVPPSAWGVRRSTFERLGGFDETFRFSEDWDFLLRAARVTQPRRVPGVTVEIRLREEGNSSADFGSERIACLRALSARHTLPELEPLTFWEVAQRVSGKP